MTYERVRHTSIMRAHSRLIDRYVAGYRPGRPTVIFVPGGMGTQLDRSSEPYTTDEDTVWGYDTVWMNAGILYGEARSLAIRPDGRDAGGHVIVPNGPLRFLRNKPYDRAWRFFSEELELNFGVFGYDWRRPLDESAILLESFLGLLRDRIKARHGEDPLELCTLLCHSMGGLVAKLFVHRVLGDALYSTEVDPWLERLVTVGTPFYGTADHMRRYYAGQEPLNRLYGADNVAALCGSLPGPAALLFLDRETWEENAVALELDRYPVRDSETDAEVDPYDEASFDRWPPWVSREALLDSRAVRATLTAPLPKPVAQRVFHLRAESGSGTPVEVGWEPVVGADWSTALPLPLKPVPGPGDGTVPRWSARLTQTAAENVYDLQHAGPHARLMEHDETLGVLWHLIEYGTLPPPEKQLRSIETELDPVRAVSDETLQQFLTEIRGGKIPRDDPRVLDEALWRRLFDEVGLC